MTSENKLVILSGAHLIGYIILIVVLFGYDSPAKKTDIYKTKHATLFNEIELIGQKYMNNKIQQTLNQQLKKPQTQILAIRNLIRHELSSYISQVKNKNIKAIFTHQEQEEAYQASHNKIMNAISIGQWESEDSHEIMQHANKIPPQKRIELLELYHNALNNNTLAQDPEVLPPPL